MHCCDKAVGVLWNSVTSEHNIIHPLTAPTSSTAASIQQETNMSFFLPSSLTSLCWRCLILETPTPNNHHATFYKHSWAVKVFLKVTTWALGVLSNPAVRPQGEAWVTAARNLRPDVCIKSKFHLTCHIPFQHDLMTLGVWDSFI